MIIIERDILFKYIFSSLSKINNVGVSSTFMFYLSLLKINDVRLVLLLRFIYRY